MINKQGINELKKEFDSFIKEQCISKEKSVDEEMEENEEEDIPNYAHEMVKKLLAPYYCGINLSRIDIKRIGDEVDASLPIKERKKMMQALVRHVRTKEELQSIMDAIYKHLYGRRLIHEELSQKFPASAFVFKNYNARIDSTKKMLERIVEEFEEIDPFAEPVEM